MTEPKRRRKQAAEPAASSPLAALCLRSLLACYFPFLALVVLANVAAAVGLTIAAWENPPLAALLGALALLFTLTLLQILWALRVLFVKIRDHVDDMELRVQREMAPDLYAWVEDIAAGRGLPAPDEIRVAADTVAHVYERVNGRQVLVFGAIAVRALPQPVLAGVVAHELGHLAAGDTSLGRAALRRHLVMGNLEAAFYLDRDALLQPGRRGGLNVWQGARHASALLNPAVWAIRLYHLLYALAHAAHSRQKEYAADREEVGQAGADAAAQALILLTVAESMPWSRLSSLAESWVAINEPAQKLFEEQARAARSLGPGEWQEAIRKELKRPTGAFDSHPGLKDRLAALGLSPKQAARMTPELSGPPSHLLFGPLWGKLERQLADRLLAPFREAHLIKMRIGEAIGSFRR